MIHTVLLSVECRSGEWSVAVAVGSLAGFPEGRQAAAAVAMWQLSGFLLCCYNAAAAAASMGDTHAPHRTNHRCGSTVLCHLSRIARTATVTPPRKRSAQRSMSLSVCSHHKSQPLSTLSHPTLSPATHFPLPLSCTLPQLPTNLPTPSASIALLPARRLSYRPTRSITLYSAPPHLKMLRGLLLILLFAFVAHAVAKTHFKEEFDSSWEDRWVISDWKKSDGTAGQWKWTAGDFYADAEADKGLQTSEDARFYAASAQFTPFSNAGKELVVQYQVRFPQRIDCGGGYIKLLPSTVDQKSFGGDSPYHIMFGPDICGTTKRTHVILTYKDKNHLIKKTVSCETDQLSHVYTLILRPDQTYEVRIDGEKKESGSLLDDWDFLPAKTIKDPSVSKPTDWVDQAQIDDPEDVKPADWDDQPKQIPDPAATKPDDWDDEADGEWEAPLIDNPAFKGEWKAKKIANPDYKGPWVHPEIDNPDYTADDSIYTFSDIGAVGFELWQVKAGTIFDNIIVTDDIKEAEALLASTYTAHKDAEKEALDAQEKEKNAAAEAERTKAADEAKKAAEAAEADEDDEDDHDEL